MEKEKTDCTKCLYYTSCNMKEKEPNFCASFKNKEKVCKDCKDKINEKSKKDIRYE